MSGTHENLLVCSLSTCAGLLFLQSNATSRKYLRNKVLGVDMGQKRHTCQPKPSGSKESQNRIRELEAELAGLHEAEQRAQQITETLQAASLALTKTLDLREILETLLDYVGELVPYDSATIFLLEKETHLVARATRGYENWIDPKDAHLIGEVSFDINQSARHRKLVTQQTNLVIPDVELDPTWEHIASSAHIRSWMGVPFVVGGKTIGLYSLDKTTPNFFNQEHIHLAGALASQAAIAIQNALLYLEAQRELSQRQQAQQAEHEQRVLAEALREISAMLSSSLELEQVLDEILTQVGRVVPYDAGTILMIKGDMVEVTHARGYDRSIKGLQLPLQETPNLHAILETGEPTVIPDTHTSDVWVSSPETSWIRSSTTAAIHADEQIIGFISLERDTPHAFTPEHLHRLQSFAQQAGIAVQNARLYTSTQQAHQIAERLRIAYLELTQSLDLTIICETLLGCLKRLIPYDSATIFLIEENQCLRAWAVHGYEKWSGDEQALSVRFDLERGTTMHAIISKQESFVVSDTAEYPAWKHIPGAEHIQSWLGVPMFLGSRIVGVCSIDSTRANFFTVNHIELAESLAAQAAFAIENARLFEEVQNQKRYSESLMQNSPVAIVTTDKVGNVQWWNPAAEALFGYSRIEAHGCNLDSLITSMEVHEEAASLSRQMFEGARVHSVTQRFHKDGTPVNVEVLGVPINVSDLEAGFIVLYHDITDLKRTEDALNKAKAKAEQANEAKSAFLASVSHELRTPLTSILGFAKIINKRLVERIFPKVPIDDPKTQKTMDQVVENLHIVASEADRLTALINDLLDLSKIEAGKLKWRKEKISTRDLIDRAASATSVMFSRKGLPLVLDVEEGLPEIIGDRDRLVQVLINLFSNGIKFTEAGSITCRAIRCEESIEFSVIDTGVGITQDDQATIFEKFRQVGDTLREKPQGTGLGLSICKEIVEHHGGRIWVESQHEKGSTFSFTIPIQHGHLESGKEADLRVINMDFLIQQLQASHASHKGSSESGQQTILIVDDDDHIRELLKQELNEAGYQVQEARDGREALDQIQEEQPDLIILDILMPEVNGFDVATTLKGDPLTMGIPIIVLSIVEDEDRGYRLGIDRYLTKPIQSSVVLEEIERLLAQGVSHQKVMLVDEETSTLKTLKKVLQSKEFEVMEVASGEEVIVKALDYKPDMIILNAKIPKQREIAKKMHSEKGLEHVSFLLFD